MREYILRTKLPARRWEDCTPVGNEIGRAHV